MREDLARTVSVTRDDEPLTLYVPHDNVLGEAMPKNSSTETKHSSGKLCFVYGRVGHSGPAGEAPRRVLSNSVLEAAVLSLESCTRAAPILLRNGDLLLLSVSLIEGEAIPFGYDRRSFLEVVHRSTSSWRRSGCGRRRPPKSSSVNEAPYLLHWDTDASGRLAPHSSGGRGYIRFSAPCATALASSPATRLRFARRGPRASASSTGRRRSRSPRLHPIGAVAVAMPAVPPRWWALPAAAFATGAAPLRCPRVPVAQNRAARFRPRSSGAPSGCGRARGRRPFHLSLSVVSAGAPVSRQFGLWVIAVL